MTPGRLEALLYDWECDLSLDRQRGDAGFFDGLLRRRRLEGGRVAVLGCGTGRVAVPLARAGWRVTGLDISPDRLEVAQGKASAEASPVWRLGDIRAAWAGPPQDAVITPYSAFLQLLTDADRLDGLTAMRAALAPEGVAIVDVSPNFPAKPRILRQLQLAAPSRTVGGWVEYYETVRQRQQTGVTVIGRRYVVRLDGGQVLRPTFVERWRHLEPGDLRALADAAGLRIVEAYADYAGSPLFAGDEIVAGAAKHIYVMAAKGPPGGPGASEP